MWTWTFFCLGRDLANPSLAANGRGVASGPSSNSEISSCNYEARKHGVKATMWLREARQKCQLVTACVEISRPRARRWRGDRRDDFHAVTAPYDFEAYSSAAVRATPRVLRRDAARQGRVHRRVLRRRDAPGARARLRPMKKARASSRSACVRPSSKPAEAAAPIEVPRSRVCWRASPRDWPSRTGTAI